MMKRLWILLGLALAACGGPNISTIRMGALYSPKGDGCHVAFENLDYQHATAAYENIGLITVSNGELTDKVREAVRPYVKGEDHKTEVLLDARDITWENTIQIQDGARAADVQTVHHLLKK